MSKIILLDCSVLSHRSIFSFGSLTLKKIQGKLPYSFFIPPAPYTYFSQIISVLKKIGVEKDDTVIMVIDDHSWRKNYDANYKANRAEFRESFKHIDWAKEYDKINKINEQLKEATNFNFVRVKNCESDDIIATACKYFDNQICVVVSIDADLDQLAFYNNVRMFSPLIKFKGNKGAYKQIDNPLAIIEKKSRLGDKSDNILVGANDTEQDYELRKFLVDLINLPEFVKAPIINELCHLPKKELHPELLPFWTTAEGKPGLGQRFLQIYDKKDVITFEECIEYAEKRKKRLAKKSKEKRDAKKKAKEEEQNCNDLAEAHVKEQEALEDNND